MIQPKILEKEVVDEIIFRTPNPRNRLMIELLAWGCTRVCDVLKFRPKDMEDTYQPSQDATRNRFESVVTSFEPVKTQRYLAKISDAETMRWNDNVHT